MSTLYTFWVINDEHMPSKREGLSDQDLWEKIVELVSEKGARWASVESSFVPMMEAMNHIDAEVLGDHGFLPTLAFNHSPHDLLGPEPESPELGYFNPERARDLDKTIKSGMKSHPQLYAAFEKEPFIDEVFHAVKDTVAEATRRGYAMAVLHDG